MLHLAALVPYPPDRAPGQRFRIEQWAPHLRRLGIEVTFLPFLSQGAMDVLYGPGRTLSKVLETLAGYSRRLSQMRHLTGYDLAFVYREAAPLGPPVLEKAVARRRPLVFDFDDAIYLPSPEGANPWASFLRPKEKTSALCGVAAHVTVGNETLAAYARSRSAHVSVVPTTIDTDRYVPVERPRNARPVIAWTGSTSTARYLAALREPLLVLRRNHAFDLRVIGPRIPLPGLDPQYVPWSPETEVAALQLADIGLMPLPDDEWARGKCGAKALQYMALRIPPVVSPIGVNERIVRDGQNGFHARTPAEWIDRLGQLLRDEHLRRHLGTAARRTVEDRYSATVWVPEIARLLHAVVSVNCAL